MNDVSQACPDPPDPLNPTEQCPHRLLRPLSDRCVITDGRVPSGYVSRAVRGNPLLRMLPGEAYRRRSVLQLCPSLHRRGVDDKSVVNFGRVLTRLAAERNHPPRPLGNEMLLFQRKSVTRDQCWAFQVTIPTNKTIKAGESWPLEELIKNVSAFSHALPTSQGRSNTSFIRYTLKAPHKYVYATGVYTRMGIRRGCVLDRRSFFALWHAAGPSRYPAFQDTTARQNSGTAAATPTCKSAGRHGRKQFPADLRIACRTPLCRQGKGVQPTLPYGSFVFENTAVNYLWSNSPHTFILLTKRLLDHVVARLSSLAGNRFLNTPGMHALTSLPISNFPL